MTKQYLDKSGLTYFWGKSKDKFVAKESGKGLSTNDYTTAEQTKLSGIETGAEVNTIETIKVNGTALTPDANKAVDITVGGGSTINVVNTHSTSTTDVYSAGQTNTEITSHIKTANTTSGTDTYSCTYLNNAIKNAGVTELPYTEGEDLRYPYIVDTADLPNKGVWYFDKVGPVLIGNQEGSTTITGPFLIVYKKDTSTMNIYTIVYTNESVYHLDFVNYAWTITNFLDADIIKTSNTTSDTNTYSCTYINNALSNKLNTSAVKTSNTTSNTDTYSCTYVNTALSNKLNTSAVKTSNTTSNSDTYSCTYVNNTFQQKGVTLYNNTNGTTGNVSLSDNPTNYNVLLIKHKNTDSGTVYNDVFIKPVLNQVYSLTRTEVNSNSAFMFEKFFTIKSNKLEAGHAYVIGLLNNVISEYNNDCIYTVIGYK